MKDIQPINPGHLLVIPNRYATYLAELDQETGVQMFRVAQRLARALRESSVRCEGMNLFMADGAAAGQEVFHVHLHVVPHYAGDRFGLKCRIRRGGDKDQKPAVDMTPTPQRAFDTPL